jgi:hypothetical protein
LEPAVSSSGASSVSVSVTLSELDKLIASSKKGGTKKMGTGQKRNSLLVHQAFQALENMKYEIANELNVDMSKVQGGYFGYMTTRETGAIGGNMVRKMIEAAERSLAQQAISGVQMGFQQGLNTSSNLNQNQDTLPNTPGMNLNNLDKFF